MQALTCISQSGIVSIWLKNRDPEGCRVIWAGRPCSLNSVVLVPVREERDRSGAQTIESNQKLS